MQRLHFFFSFYDDEKAGVLHTGESLYHWRFVIIHTYNNQAFVSDAPLSQIIKF